MRLHRSLTLAAVAPVIATVAAAQGVSPLVMEGDNVPGVGNVTTIDKLWINASGDHLVKVTTDNPSAGADEAILKNGVLYLFENQAVTSPAGASLNEFDAMCINSNGDSAYNVTLSGTGSTATDAGVYWNDKLVLQKGDFSTANVFSLQTPYIAFDEVRCNDNNQILLIGAVDDGAVTGTSEAVIMRLDLDANGNLLSDNPIRIAGDPSGTSLSPATLFGTNPIRYDFNNAGQALYQVYMATGSGANDVAVMLDNVVIAEEAAPSPIAGRNWNALSAPGMGLNNNGDWVLKGFLDGSNADNGIIIKNDVKVVQKGDVLAATGGFLLQNFGQAGVEIADSGDVLWYGDWDDTNTNQDTGLFLNLDLLVQEGVTTVGTATVKKLNSGAQGFHIADSGNFVIFEAELDNGLEGAFLIGTGEPGSPTCYGDGTSGLCPCANVGGAGQGCANSMGQGAALGATGSPSIASANISFGLTGIAPFKPALLVSNQSMQMGPFGDGLTCIGSVMNHHGVVWANASGNATWSPSQISNPTWVPSQDTYFQVIYRDQGGPCFFGFNTSSAYKVTFIP